MPNKLVAHSYERYRGGMHVKRIYGSGTVTRFYVFHAGDERNANRWLQIETMGRTPGDRKTLALKLGAMIFSGDTNPLPGAKLLKGAS